MLQWLKKFFCPADATHVSAETLRAFERSAWAKGWEDGPYWPLKTERIAREQEC